MADSRENPDFVNKFLQYSAMELNKSLNSIKGYNYDLTNFFKFMSNHLGYSSEPNINDIDIHSLDTDFLKKITLDDIRSYIYYLREKYDIKSTTMARKLSTIRIFFKYMTEEKIIEINPTQNLKNPKIEKRLPKYLTLEESKKLLNVTSNEDNKNAERDYAIITLFLNCGIRLAELVGINITDIKFDECKMTVIGKRNKERTIYLNKACMEAIKNYLAVRPKEKIKEGDEDALFLSSRLERISRRSVQYIVEKELKRAGLDTTKYSTHKLRHTAATLIYQFGDGDILALQELLGHKSVSTTEIYTHISNENVRSAVESNPLAGETSNIKHEN